MHVLHNGFPSIMRAVLRDRRFSHREHRILQLTPVKIDGSVELHRTLCR
jgi:hypothetical protein